MLEKSEVRGFEMRKVKIAAMIAEYFNDWDSYSWDDAGQPGISAQLLWVNDNLESLKDHFREISEDRANNPDGAVDAAVAILREVEKMEGGI